MGDIELQIFSNRLKDLRNKRGITQKDFAENIGVTAAALSAYENNLKNPSIAVAKRIAEAYSVSIDWLCGLTEKENFNDQLITYADLFRELIKITEYEVCFKHWEIETRTTEKDLFNLPNIALLSICDNTVISFFLDWKKMYSLYISNTIDKRLYNLWLSDWLKQYENIKLEPEAAGDNINM